MRRRFMLSLAGSVLLADRVLAQSAHQHVPLLPEAASSTEPYARLQGGVAHHLSADQEAQRWARQRQSHGCLADEPNGLSQQTAAKSAWTIALRVTARQGPRQQ